MKILVFDDSREHRQAAHASLKGHDLTVVGTYDEAQKALVSHRDYEESKRLFAERYSGSPYDGEREGISAEVREERIAFSKECDERATTYPDFDIVMTDLLVPASSQALGGEGMRYAGQQMPLGAIIALLALSNGVKNVAVMTDENHHHHPASAAFDCFGKNRADGVNIVCMNRPEWVKVDESTGEAVDEEFLKSDAGKQKYPHLNPEDEEWGYGPRKGLVSGKNWGELLQRLTK